MPDYQENRVTGVSLSLTGSFNLVSGYTDHTSLVGYEGKSFLSAPEIDFSKIATLSSAIEDEECLVSNIPAPITDTLVYNLWLRYAYPEVSVDIYSWEINDDGSINTTTNVWHLWHGLLFMCDSHLLRRYISIESRNIKYYADKVAGVACVEQCKCSYFGDAICGKTVTSQTRVIDTITGYVVSFTAGLTGDDGLFRSGYISFGGLDVKILEWSSTTPTQVKVAIPPPVEWLGQSVSVNSGCDRTYETCENIHDNTEKGLFYGINMVDYNTYYETG